MSRTSMTRLPVLGFILGAVTLAAGCGVEAPKQVSETGPPAFAIQIDEAIGAAQSGGASDDQLSILASAKREGRVTFDHARSAVLSSIECVVAGGGTASYYEQIEPSGLPMPIFVLEAKDEPTLAKFGPLMDRCATLESFWVNKVYQLQPSSQEIRDTYLKQRIPAFVTCLSSHGYAVDADSSPDEILYQVLDVQDATGGAVDCYTDQ